MPFLTLPSGKQLYYENYGTVGPVVILIHGLASSSHLWNRQVRTLQKYCRVYLFDLPGHGLSDRQKVYSLQEFADILKFLLDKLGISRVSIIAISLGCSVALTFAINNPERVDKLILEGPIGGYHPLWNPLGWEDHIVFFCLPLFLQLSFLLFGSLATAHWINTFGVKAKRNLQSLESLQEETDFTAVRDLLWDSACTPYAGRLGYIDVPVLLVRGCNDPMPKRFVDYIKRHLRQVTYSEVPNTRHLVVMEKPRLFNTMILNFLAIDTGDQSERFQKFL